MLPGLTAIGVFVISSENYLVILEGSMLIAVRLFLYWRDAVIKVLRQDPAFSFASHPVDAKDPSLRSGRQGHIHYRLVIV